MLVEADPTALEFCCKYFATSKISGTLVVGSAIVLRVLEVVDDNSRGKNGGATVDDTTLRVLVLALSTGAKVDGAVDLPIWPTNDGISATETGRPRRADNNFKSSLSCFRSWSCSPCCFWNSRNELIGLGKVVVFSIEGDIVVDLPRRISRARSSSFGSSLALIELNPVDPPADFPPRGTEIPSSFN